MGPQPGRRSRQQARPGVGRGPQAPEEAGDGAPAGAAKPPASAAGRGVGAPRSGGGWGWGASRGGEAASKHSYGSGMPVPQQRDLEVARDALTTWLGDRLAADDVRLSDITSPAFTGFSNETLLFDAEWTAHGEPHRQGMVARVKPTGYTIFLESVFEEQYRVMEALGAHSDVPVPPVIGY